MTSEPTPGRTVGEGLRGAREDDPVGDEGPMPTGPVLDLLLPEPPDERRRVVCALPDPALGWREALDRAIVGVGAGDVVLVLCDRGLRRALLRLLVHGRWTWRRTPSVGGLRRALEARGLVIRAPYALWTAAQAPRVAFRLGDRRVLRWFQVSGVLGDVGRFPLLRALSRSRLAAAFGGALAPAFAAVAERRT